jgi:uncharacterized glyoxalase superfamily protein PhnB
MKVEKLDSFMVWSENPKELADWYIDTFNFELRSQLNLPDDTGYDLKIGNENIIFWIGYHDKVHGKNNDPYRIMIGFIVDDVYKAYEELKTKGVEFIAEPKISPTNDYDVATAVDPEGNIIQLFHYH